MADSIWRVRRLPAVASLLTVGLLLTATMTPATADPDQVSRPSGQGVTSSQAQQALSAARGLLTAPPAQRRAASPAGLAHGRSATVILRDLWQAQPRLTGADRAAAGRLLSRPTTGDNLGGIFFQLPAGATKRDCRTSTRFCVHYATSGEHRSTAAFAATAARTLDHVHGVFTGNLGYRKPTSDGGWASSLDRGNPNGKFDVFLGNLGQYGIYGYCTLDQFRASSYCALDNDFSEFSGTPMNSLKATAAHEYFHAIQFAYDPSEDGWLMEGSAVWAEERAYDGVNDYLQYVRGDSVITNPVIPSDQDSVHNIRVYSSMLFFEHLTQTLGVNRMRDVWKATQGTPYSLQSIRRVVARHTNWEQFINRFAMWNSRPPGIGYSERDSYPGGRFTVTKRLGLNTTRTLKTSTMRRDHLASGAIRLIPARASTSTQRIKITINGPNTARGAVATLQRRWSGRATEAPVIHLNRYGNATLTQPFGKGKISSLVITFANASTRMRDCGTGGPVSYSCGGRGRFVDPWQITATVIR